VEIPGLKPGEKLEKKGASTYYGITIPDGAINEDLAVQFVRFVLEPGNGGRIIESSGQNAINRAFSAKSKSINGLIGKN
jgi:hypothetical protein